MSFIQADVVSDDQRDQMNAMTLDKERAGYLLDNVIIPSLKVDIREPFYNFLEVLKEDENPVVKAIGDELRSRLGPPMPQPNPGQYPPPTGPAQYPPSTGQPYPTQYPQQPYPAQYPQQPYPAQYPQQPQPGQYPPPTRQPYPGQ